MNIVHIKILTYIHDICKRQKIIIPIYVNNYDNSETKKVNVYVNDHMKIN